MFEINITYSVISMVVSLSIIFSHAAVISSDLRSGRSGNIEIS